METETSAQRLFFRCCFQKFLCTAHFLSFLPYCCRFRPSAAPFFVGYNKFGNYISFFFYTSRSVAQMKRLEKVTDSIMNCVFNSLGFVRDCLSCSFFYLPSLFPELSREGFNYFLDSDSKSSSYLHKERLIKAVHPLNFSSLKFF